MKAIIVDALNGNSNIKKLSFSKLRLLEDAMELFRTPCAVEKLQFFCAAFSEQLHMPPLETTVTASSIRVVVFQEVRNISPRSLCVLLRHLRRIPCLEELTLDISGMGTFRFRDASSTMEWKPLITDALIEILRQGTLKELNWSMYGVEVIDLIALCRELQTNSCLRKLNGSEFYVGTSETAGPVLAEALHHNTTLIEMTLLDRSHHQKHWYQAIEYYLALNRCGRGTVRAADFSLDDLLTSLLEAFKEKENVVVSIIFYLLHECPFIWNGCGGDCRPLQREEVGRGQKRKRETTRPSNKERLDQISPSSVLP